MSSLITEVAVSSNRDPWGWWAMGLLENSEGEWHLLYHCGIPDG